MPNAPASTLASAPTTADLTPEAPQVPRPFWVTPAIACAWIAIVVLVCSPFMLLGLFPATHEANRYSLLTMHFRDALSAGIVYPRWLPDLGGGFGYPTFCFYQPLFFYASAGISLMTGLNATASTLAAVVMFLLIGTAGAYRLARNFTTPAWSLWFAWIYMLTPYLYVNFYVRGDLSELTSMMWMPWPLHFLMQIADRLHHGHRITLSALGMAFSLGAIIVSHPISAAAYFAIFPCLVLAVMWDRPDVRWRTGLVASCAIAGALALTLVYWLPVLQLKPYVQLERATGGYYIPGRHTIYPTQFFWRAWDFRGSVPDSPLDGMSFQLGLPHFLLAITGLYIGRQQRWMWVTALAYVGLMLLMSNALYFAWYVIKPLAIVQFPWRLLTVTGILQFALALGWTRCESSQRRNWGIAIFTLITMWYYYPQFSLNPELRLSITQAEEESRKFYDSSLNTSQTCTIENEFLPKTAITSTGLARGPMPIAEVSTPGQLTFAPDHSKHHLRFHVETTQPVMLGINQFYFPGWRIRVNGATIPEQELQQAILPDGRMLFGIPAGAVDVEAYYAGPPGGLQRGLAICGTLLAIATVLYFVERKTALTRPA